MPNRTRWTAFSLAGLLLAAAGSLAYAAATETAAQGLDAGDEAEATGTEATQVRQSRIKLVVDHDGAAEQLEIADLHEMAVGESRTLETASGTPVVVTRDEQGFELDIAGKKIRLMDHFSGEPGEMSWTGAGGEGTFHRKIVVQQDGDAESGNANVMILRNKVAAEGGETADGQDVVMLRRAAGDGAHAFAFTTGEGELAALPLPVEATIARLQASAKFQQLDEATRATVLEALRESAPKPRVLMTGEPGAKTIVLELQDQQEATPGN